MQCSLIIKLTLLCCCLCTACGLTSAKKWTPVSSSAVNGAASALPPPHTLTQDLAELQRLIPTKPINKLIKRYLLNDAQFQAFVRIINSHDAYVVRMRLYAQPEVIQFRAWVRSQLIQSGGKGSLELDDSEEVLDLFNPTPYWSVYGWQGFFNELLAYFPQEMLRAQIDAKVSQGGSFAQFWTRVKGLRPVYEHVLSFPESKRIIAQLEQNGIVFSQIDQFVRSLFDWQQNVAQVDLSATNNQGLSGVPPPSATVVPAVAPTTVGAFV